MKSMISILTLVILMFAGFQAPAAIGCLPGDCCNGRPCSGSPRNPHPRDPPRDCNSRPFLLESSSVQLANAEPLAVPCIPGGTDCCNGRKCGPNNPRPRDPQPPSFNEQFKARLESCVTQQVQECASCGTDAKGCTPHMSETGHQVGFSCVYCM